MGESLKVLGQVTPAAVTLTTLYTVPSSFSAVVSSITVCNLNPSITATFRVSIAQGGAADAPAQYIYFDLPILPNDTFIATIGVSLAMNDVVRVYSSNTNVAFNLLGVEVGDFAPPPANLAGGDLAGFYPNPTVIGLQTNDVYPDILGPLEDGYALVWDNTDGYWRAKGIITADIDAVVFDSGSPSENIRSNRSVDQSPIVNTFEGIVNLSSKTTGASAGANANFATIIGGDQNEVDGDYSIIGGGLQNIINAGATHGVIGGGFSNTINGTVLYGTIAGGLGNIVDGEYGAVVGGQNNTAGTDSVAGGNNNQATGNYAVAFGLDNVATGLGAVALGGGNIANGTDAMALGFQCIASRFGQLTLSSCGGNVNGNPADSQNGNLVYSNSTKATTIAVASNGVSLPTGTINVGNTQGFPSAGTINVTTGAGVQTVAYTGTAGGNQFTGCTGGTGTMSTGGAVNNIGFPFTIESWFSGGAIEFIMTAAVYYHFKIMITVSANNAAVGPAYWEYNILAHIAGGLAIIDNQQQNITTPDTHATGWLTSISVDGTTAALHINVNPNTDTTNTLNAVADIRWAEVAGFSQ